MEIRLMFAAVLPRLASIGWPGDVPRMRGNFINGVKRRPSV
ncbi:hypothetical protein [Amycolatopsis sp. DG1A-15b]|nr:hypothetical protein [Amycolatopsis sp. DG1A-15b]WIX87138.1 hypothetical protein QRY02_39250 [Amycolatopsis sp. DG1A-15b]